MVVEALIAAALAAAIVSPHGQAMETTPAALPEATAEAPTPALAPIVLPRGTMVRLMVTREVNSRDNHPGDRFALRVDEDVRVHDVTVIPVGTRAWGELIDAAGTEGLGKSGKLSARLLYVEAGGQRIDLEGSRQSTGSGGTGSVVAGVLAFGVFGLFMKGANATLKAGEILNGYTVADAAVAAPATKP
jgi:hypothetical protein